MSGGRPSMKGLLGMGASRLMSTQLMAAHVWRAKLSSGARRGAQSLSTLSSTTHAVRLSPQGNIPADVVAALLMTSVAVICLFLPTHAQCKIQYET